MQLKLDLSNNRLENFLVKTRTVITLIYLFAGLTKFIEAQNLIIDN